MCGRFTLSADANSVIEHFALQHNVVLKPRYNIAPDQVVPVICAPWRLDFLTWGLRPHWLAADRKGFINARADTIHTKPSFKNSFKSRRALIIADGFYEWKLIGKIKQPYHHSLPNSKLFAFAGIREGHTCAIITKDHNPVIIDPQDYAKWLSNTASVYEVLQIINKENSASFTIYPVSTTVNNTRNDFALCIKALQ